MEMKDALLSRLRHLRRISPSPTAVSRVSDVVRDLPPRSIVSRKHEVDRQVSEIERLVKLAEQYAADRRQEPAFKSSTRVQQMREQTGDNIAATRPRCPVMNVHQDVILVPVARTLTPVSATATVSDSRHRCLRGRQSPLTLSQLLGVKSLERCPKCHKVRLDTSSSSQDVTTTQSHNSGSGRYSSGLVKFRALVADSSTSTAANGHSQLRKTPVKATEPFRVKPALSTTPTFNPSRDFSMINTTPFNKHKGRSQCRGPRVPVCNSAVVMSSDSEGQHDVNNNYDCDSGKTTGRSTWPRKANDCQMLNADSSTSTVDNGRPSSCLRVPVWRKRSSLIAVQQAWAEESTQRTTGDEVEENLNNSPPSAASSYDPLDTVDNADRLSTETSVNGYSTTVLTHVTDVSPITDKRHQTTSSAVLQQPQRRTKSIVTGKLQCPDNVRNSARRNANTNATNDHHSAVKAATPSSVGVPAQLVISVPVISWASRAPNPRRRTVCVAPTAQQFHTHTIAVSRARSSKRDVPRDHQRHIYNYGQSCYDGLNQLD